MVTCHVQTAVCMSFDFVELQRAFLVEGRTRFLSSEVFSALFVYDMFVYCIINTNYAITVDSVWNKNR